MTNKIWSVLFSVLSVAFGIISVVNIGKGDSEFPLMMCLLCAIRADQLKGETNE